MLQLFKSKIRAGLLRLFFYNPQKEFYIRQLAKILNTSAGNTQKELRKLEADAIIKSKKMGNLRIYTLNQTLPLYPVLQQIITKTIGIESVLKENLKYLPGIKYAFIFGSYAKGELKADSDIDLFIVGNINEDGLLKIIKNVEKMILRDINYHIDTSKSFHEKLKEKYFYREITQKYILLTENDDEFRKFIQQT